MTIFAETERLILRELITADKQGIFELDSDPEVQQYLGGKTIKSIVQAEEAICFIRQQYIDNGIGRWAIIEKNTGAFLGWTGLKLITEKTNKHINYYDLGYRLLKKHWGNGYAAETVKAVLAYGFETLQLKEIYAMADSRNFASIKILEKAGLSNLEKFDYCGEEHNWLKITCTEWEGFIRIND